MKEKELWRLRVPARKNIVDEGGLTGLAEDELKMMRAYLPTETRN